jgi:hypothetical protein
LFEGGADSGHDGGDASSGTTQLRFGDVVVLSDGTLGVVAEPASCAGLVTCLELDGLGNLARCGRDAEILMAPRDSIHRVVGCRSELGEEIRRAIERFRSQPAETPDGILGG